MKKTRVEAVKAARVWCLAALLAFAGLAHADLVGPVVAIQDGDTIDVLARIFHRSRATNEYGIALVCPKIQVSNLDQRAGNAEAKLYRRN